MIPDKIYNEDGSPYVYPYYLSMTASHPFSGNCVRYDKKTDTYYAMSELRPGYPDSYKFNRTFTKDSRSYGGTFNNEGVERLFELFVKQSGIDIKEGGMAPGQWQTKREERRYMRAEEIEPAELQDSPWSGWAEKYIEDKGHVGLRETSYTCMGSRCNTTEQLQQYANECEMRGGVPRPGSCIE